MSSSYTLAEGISPAKPGFQPVLFAPFKPHPPQAALFRALGIDAQIVGRITAVRFKQHVVLPPHKAGKIRLLCLPGGRHEPLHALVLERGGKVGLFEGSRPLPRGEGKDVHAREAGLLHDGEGIFKVRLALAGKADDDVRRDGGVGEGLVDLTAGGKVFGAGVAAVHRTEHRVRPALQREMEMGHEVALFHGGKQLVRDGALFHRTQTDAGGNVL